MSQSHPFSNHPQDFYSESQAFSKPVDLRRFLPLSTLRRQTRNRQIAAANLPATTQASSSTNRFPENPLSQLPFEHLKKLERNLRKAITNALLDKYQHPEGQWLNSHAEETPGDRSLLGHGYTGSKDPMPAPRLKEGVNKAGLLVSNSPTRTPRGFENKIDRELLERRTPSLSPFPTEQNRRKIEDLFDGLALIQEEFLRRWTR